jgi:Protein of unknown function (DUF2946)
VTSKNLLTVLTAKIILAAFLLVNIAPALSAAASSSNGSKQARALSALNVICTSAGLRFIHASDTENSPSNSKTIHAGNHCPWCALGAPPVLPAISLSLFLHTALAHVEVDSQPVALAIAPIWRQTLARGPPKFSV